MCEIEIKYTHVKLEEVIVDLAHHIEQGYRIVSLSTELSHSYGGDNYTVCLVKN